MSEIVSHEGVYNPLKLIFKKNKNGEYLDELSSIRNISLFFEYIENENIPSENKLEVMKEFKEKIKVNRHIIGYFSTHENKSIYIVLFNLYLSPSTHEDLKSLILDLIKELIINIKISKEIFEYIFQKFSEIYRGEGSDEDPKLFYHYLTLLNSIVEETENIQKPRNYFACSGKGKFEVNLKNNNIQFGKNLTIIMNFKIGETKEMDESPTIKLLEMKFSNGQTFTLELEKKMFLFAKDIQKDTIKAFPVNEYVTLIMFITNYDSKLEFNFYFSGENKANKIKGSKKFTIKQKDFIENISFFEDFYGEVTSMAMLIHKDKVPNKVNDFVKGFQNFKEGIWKPKIFKKFLNFLKNIEGNEITEMPRSKTVKNQDLSDKISVNDFSKNLIFLFTPFNYYDNNPGLVESSIGPYYLNFNGNIRNHQYQCFQKKLKLIGGISNLLPLVELFIIHSNTLTEENFILFLKIINNILNERKNNMKSGQEVEIFKILSLFIEKFPNHLFTENILNIFSEIGKTIFRTNYESLCSSYFKHILLNEKILSKYSETLQIKFWNQILLFCESDKDQIETFMNINRICLILRFYDRNKYTEMCCQAHLSQFKDEYIENKTIMNPPMSNKLQSLENILNIVIVSQYSDNIISLFKLLTLDLSPCLTKFILNVFTTALKKSDNNWKERLVTGLMNNKFETIIMNTFIHSLPDVRFDAISFMNEVYKTLLLNGKQNKFKTFEKMIKTSLLPSNMFYATKLESKTYLNEKQKKFKELQKDEKINNPINENNNDENLYEDKEISNNNEENIQTNAEDNNNNENPNPNEPKDNPSLTLEDVDAKHRKLFSMSVINPLKQLNFNQNVKKNVDFEEFLKKEEEMDKLNPKYNVKEIVLTDDLFSYYKKHLFDVFFMWALNQPIDITFNEIELESCRIDNLNILEIVFSILNEINDDNMTTKFFESIITLIKSNKENGFIILCNEKIFSFFLEKVFSFYKKENNNKNYELGKNIIFQIFINSLIWIEKNKKKFNPCKKIENVFIWGDFHLMKNQDEATIDNMFEFINELLLGLLTEYKINFESKMNFNINADITKNYYLYNYFIMITKLFIFSYHFEGNLKFETQNSNKEISLTKNIMENYTESMRLNYLKIKLNEMWINYPFFEEIFNKTHNIWSKTNTYKKYNISKAKTNKVIKYEDILHKILLDKNLKNIYQKELTFLCYEEKDPQTKTETILPLIRIIPICLMSIISLYSQTNNENEFKYWLKEYKNFIRFIILAATNLTRVNQLEVYSQLQEKCINPILTFICFMKDIMVNGNLCKDKIRSSLQSIIILCFMITKYEHNYIVEHKKGIKIFNIGKKLARNDLRNSVIYLIFTEIIKDRSGNTLLPAEKLEQLYMSQYVSCIDYLDKDEFYDSFYNNPPIIKRINEDFFTFHSFKRIKEERNNPISNIIDEVSESYKKEILELLPLYEKELMKNSNNSLENKIKKKNIYKTIKKKSFSWGGLWSDKKLFFENVNNLKLKLINHYTKTLMKPLLVPILDISYYLPEFSKFKPENLFNTNENTFKLTMDIDKILKLSEQNQITLNNIKESFGGKKSKIKENYLRKINIKSNPEQADILIKISNNLDFGKEEEFLELKQENIGQEQKKKYFLSCLVKTSHHIKGVCFIDKEELSFKVFLNQRTGNSMSGVEIGFTTKDDDYDHDRQTCFGSYFVCHPKDKDLYKISINYNDIKYIFRRRYYYKNSALELFTINNKSFYLNFKFEEDRETVLNEILNKIGDTAKIVDDLKDEKDAFDNIIGYENNKALHYTKKNKKTKISKKIEMWKEWEINNFELLMWLNIYSNRSYNDISQYPVFPWILSSYEDPLQINKKNTNSNNENINISINLVINNEVEEGKKEYNYRDMKLPMGMMEFNDDGKRKELFMETYETLISDNENQEIKPYIYGSNYSNPVYVCNYLMRLFPFTHISIELQGHKFDDPDRLFFSVKNSFYNSTTQKTDLRELIPEFFYLPEMFLNLNDLNMGVREDGTKVNNVLTPCGNNPYDFIISMKTILENDKISYSIQNWIDLIFGYKVKGKEAEVAYNLFTEASYQENIDIKKLENKESYLRMVEFGLIPNQILTKECYKKIKKEDKLKGIKQFTDQSSVLLLNKVKPQEQPDKISEGAKLLLIGSFDSERLSLFYSDGSYLEKKIVCPVFDKIYNSETININQVEGLTNCMSEFYSPSSKNNKAMKFINNGKSIILGGFFDGKVIITHLDNKKSNEEFIPFNDNSPILSITANKEEEFIFIGNSLGNIAVYKANLETQELTVKSIIIDQISPISHLYCCDELNLWSSASIDGYIYLYTLPLCKLVRGIKVPTKHCSYAFLSDSPLPAVIVLSDEDDTTEIFAYSINGKFYGKKKESYKLINPMIVKDINSLDYLVCVGNDGVNIINLPDLSTQKTIENLRNILYICPNEENKILYALNKKGNEIIVINEENKKAFRSASFFLKQKK